MDFFVELGFYAFVHSGRASVDFALGYEFIGERVTMKNRQGSHLGPSCIRHGIQIFPFFARALETAAKMKASVGWSQALVIVIVRAHRSAHSSARSSLSDPAASLDTCF